MLNPANPANTVGVVIHVPPEAVVPLLIGSVALCVLIFAGTALAAWKAKHPEAARTVGLVLGAGLSLVAAYLVYQVFPLERENDAVHEGIYYFSFFDGAVAAFIALMATIMWRWAGQRMVALAVGGALGLALVLKPFIHPLGTIWDGKVPMRGTTDLEHLSYILPGIVLLIVTSIVAFGKTRVPQRDPWAKT